MDDLSIKEVAARTGLAAGTIRAWEQRYGFPQPARTAGGYRRYSSADVDALRRALLFRERGLSIATALERARASGQATDRPSLYAAVNADPGAHRALRKRTLLALSRAIEDEAMARASAPVCIGAFQEERFYRRVEHRYQRLAQTADATVVFADFATLRRPERRPIEVPVADHDALGNEWAVIVDAPGFAACMLAWEPPTVLDRDGPRDDERRFESILTTDPRTTRQATLVAARLAGRVDPALGAELEELLVDRPLAAEAPTPALTSLTTRMIDYLEPA